MTVYQVEPSTWVREGLLMAITGLGKKQIENYRLYCWAEGVHFTRSSSKGISANGRSIMYNRVEIDRYFGNKAA